MEPTTTFEEFQLRAQSMLKMTPEQAALSNCDLLNKYCLFYFGDSDDKLYLGKVYSESATSVIVAFDDMDLASFPKYEARCALCYDNIIPAEYKDGIEDTITCLEKDRMVMTLRLGSVEEARVVFEQRRERRLQQLQLRLEQ